MQSHVDSSVKAHLQLVAAHAKLQKTQIEQQKTQLGTLTSELYLLKTALKSVFVPPPVFTMTNFQQHMNDKDQWFSPSFHSHIGGYEMCISVCANGYGEGVGSHLSVFLHMMPGKHDDYLKWPFRGEVTVELVDQRRNANHWEVTLLEENDYSFDDIMLYVDRVRVKKRGPGWGFDEFISHRQLTYKTSRHLINNCLKFRVNKVVMLG